MDIYFTHDVDSTTLGKNSVFKMSESVSSLPEDRDKSEFVHNWAQLYYNDYLL